MINKKTPDNPKLTLDQFRRLMWYANRQKNEGSELFPMDDVIDQQLHQLGYTSIEDKTTILVTEAGLTALDSSNPREPSQVVRFKGIEHRFQSMLIANENLVWTSPRLTIPENENAFCQPDIFSLKKSIMDLRPTAYYFHRDEQTIGRWSEPGINMIAEYCYVVCHEEKSFPSNLPASFGVIVESRDGVWSKTKPAVRNNVLADRDFFLQMVLDRKGIRG